MKDDEKFLEGINLITGDKIDYAKKLLVLALPFRLRPKLMPCASIKNYPTSINLCISSLVDRRYKSGLSFRILPTT